MSTEGVRRNHDESIVECEGQIEKNCVRKDE